jgi:hypothetical protein
MQVAAAQTGSAVVDRLMGWRDGSLRAVKAERSELYSRRKMVSAGRRGEQVAGVCNFARTVRVGCMSMRGALNKHCFTAWARPGRGAWREPARWPSGAAISNYEFVEGGKVGNRFELEAGRPAASAAKRFLHGRRRNGSRGLPCALPTWP